MLWINYLEPAWNPLLSYPKAMYVVAKFDTPNIVFTIVNEKANVEVSGGGDFAILVDPKDEKAYISYDAWGNSHRVKVEQLTDDYLDSLGKNASSETISPSGNEAPMIFERKGYYYLLYGHTCCFCEEGAGAHVFVAKHPLGPWTSMDTDINPEVKGERTIKAQNNFVIQLGEEYIYTGDLWASAHDQMKSHDLQYWYPLRFDDTKEPPSILPMTWKDSVEINISNTNEIQYIQ